MNKSFFTKLFSAILIVMLALGALPITPAYAATSGPNLPDVGANVNGPGTVNWTNPGNVISDNNAYATVAVNNSTSEYLQATDFDFAIPAGATINGIQVTIGRFGTTGPGQDIQDNVVQLIKGGTLVGNNLGDTATDWPNAEATANYGSAANLWGTTWTPAEINAINFGVALAVDSTNNRTASVDYIQVTVTYSLNSTTVGVATATAGGNSSINVSMPYTDDANANNTYTVEYCLTSANCPVSGSWITFVSGAAHSASPFATSITGLVPATSYDVRVTYADADGFTGTNPQTITNVTTAACGGSLTYTIPAGSDRVVVVIVSSEGGGAIGTPNLSGFGAATLIANPVNGNARIYAGYRVVGTSAVAQATTITATNGTCFYANTYTGINQTVGTGVSNTINSSATGTAAAGNTTTNTSVFNAAGGAVVNQAGGRVIYATNMNNAGPSGTGTSGVWTFSELFDGSQTADGNRTAVGQSTTTTAGSATITVTDGGTAHNRSVLVGFALNPAITNTAPNAPSAINQYRTDTTTVITQGGYTNQTQVVFKATATDPEANQYQLQVEVQPNANAFTNTATCSSPLTNSGTETSTGSCGAFVSGTSYKWQYRLLDSVGAATAWTSFGGSDPDFTVDTTVPDTTITANPPALANSSTALFSFTGSDPGGSGIASFQCQIDGGGFSACTSSQNYLGLSDGSHTFQVRAIDNAGNTDATPASYTWTVDTTAPAAPVVTTPANGSVTNNPTPSVSGTAEPNSTVTVYIDGSSVGSATADGSGNWNYTPVAALGNGSHTVRATATDGAGNTSPNSNTNTFTVDTTAPDTTITANPTNPTNSASASFSFIGNDPGGSGVASFQCQIDGGGFSACTSSQNYVGLSDGSHTFQVRAIDNAGNTDATPASYTWTIDTAAPDTNIVSNPTNPSNDNTPTFDFSSPDVTATFECSIDGNAFSACTTPNTLATLADGPHTFAVRAVDLLGNTDASPASYTWTIDTVSPDTSIDSSPVNPSNDNTPTFIFSSPDVTATFECSIDGSAFSACITPDTLAALADGLHTFAVRAVDPAGNVDATPASYTWTIDATAPDTTIDSNPTNPSNNATPTFTFSSPDATATFECSLDGNAFSACTSPNTLAALADGSHTFAVRAIDLLGNVDPSPASYTWTVNTSAPIVTNVTSTTPNGTYFPGDIISIQVTFDEAVNVTGTPQLQLELGAVDGFANYVSGSGTDTLTFTYTVQTGDNTPDLDYVANTSLTLNGGSIQDTALNNANLTLPNPAATGSLGANKDIVIDALVLTVVNNGVGSVPDTGDGSISENEQVVNTLNINQLVVTFNKDVYDVPASTTDTDEVDNPANYILVRSATGVFNTLSCAGGVVAPDIITPVASVTYSNGGGSGPFVATVTLSTPITTDGYYRLFVCGTTSIVQANNTALALAGNGIANGTDFVRNFQLVAPAAGGGGGGGAGARENALAVAALPATGFAPGRITKLPVQPDELAYSDLGEMWIEIPSLGIKTSIVGVPQTADGEWDVTWLANNVGWLNGTAFPTWEGNSVVTAHVTNADGVDGPFSNLKKLKYGDQIIIHLYGQKYIFEVRNSRLSRPFTTSFAFEDLEDASYLTLITCQTYLPKSDSYMHRRVVRAVLISVENE